MTLKRHIALCLPWALSVILVLLSQTLLAGEPDADTQREKVTFDELVANLAHPEFAIRKQAARRLEKLGVRSKAALVAALAHDDPEVRYRAKQILLRVLEEDLELRLETFVRRVDDAEDDLLPSWPIFKELAGSTAQARALYVAAVRAEPFLMEAIDQDPAYATMTLRNRTEELTKASQRRIRINGQYVRRQVSLGSAIALMAMAAAPNIVIDDQTGRHHYQIFYQTPVREAATQGPQREPLRRLLGRWIRRRASPMLAYYKLTLATRFDLKEDGLGVAKTLMLQRGAHPYHRQTAILAVARWGSEVEIESLNKLLEDDTDVMGTNRNPRGKAAYACQIRDVALAVAVHLSGQQPKDFGFKRIRPSPKTVFQPNTMGFENLEKRKAAFKKWRAQAAKHPQDIQASKAGHEKSDGN